MKFAFVLFAGLALCSSVALAGETSGNPAFQQRLEADVQQLVKPDEPGIAICVAVDGAIASLVARGRSDLERATSLTVDTPVYIASLAKGFTTVAILKLVEDKKLSLDDRVVERMPGLPAYMAPVTVRHLLTHTSGVPDYDDAFASKPGLTNAEVMAFLGRQKGLNAPAGTEWNYSNAGFVVLAELFKAVSGEPLDHYIATAIFQPLGMTNSFFLTGETQGRARAIGYQKSDRAWVRDDYDARTIGPGGIYASARDLCAWGIALDTGKILKRMTLVAAYTPYVHSGALPTPMGLGFQVEDIAKGPLKGEWYAALFGDRDGFRAVDMRLKSHRFRYFQLANSSRQLEPMTVPDLYFGE